MQLFNIWYKFLVRVSFFRVNSCLYAAGEKGTTVKQTSTDIVLLAVCISVLYVGIRENDL